MDRPSAIVQQRAKPDEETEHNASSNSEESHTDTTDPELSPCQLKTSPNIPSSATIKAPSPVEHQGTSLPPSHCQYIGSGSKPYGSQSCMGSSEQIYYPHHSPVNRGSATSSFLPVSTSALLQSSSSLSLHAMDPQMQACRLSQQSSDCALRQSSGHLTSSSHSSYGGLRTTPPSQHPSLPSCTYMQPSQAYPTHLTPNVHMMNMNFPGPMA